jgi:uncharacterized protein (UPF0332 family)
LSEVAPLFRNVTRSLDAAQKLLDLEYVDFAASRAYYGCFYVAEALLLDEGLSFSRNGSVIGEYGRLFVRTERLDRRFHRLLNRTFAARQTADYDTDFDLDRFEVHGFIEEGRSFLSAARDYVDHEDAEVEDTRPENG